MSTNKFEEVVKKCVLMLKNRDEHYDIAGSTDESREVRKEILEMFNEVQQVQGGKMDQVIEAVLNAVSGSEQMTIYHLLYQEEWKNSIAPKPVIGWQETEWKIAEYLNKAQPQIRG